MGAALLLTGKGGAPNFLGDFSGSALGYASALACALIWSSYSILSRSMKSASSDAVAVNCLATAGLSLVCHLAFETTVWPQNGTQWLAVAGLGLLPVGVSFSIWDYGVKHGNIQFLGSAAYLAPLISTLILVAAGFAAPTWQLAAAALLITLGALVASGRVLPRAKRTER